MTARQPILSVLAMEKLLKRNGARRVGEQAKEELRDALEERANELCRKAIEYAAHARRNTVMGEDVKLARK